jgi:hypothetical protein
MQRLLSMVPVCRMSSFLTMGLVAAAAACGGSGTTPPPYATSGMPAGSGAGGSAGSTVGSTGATSSGTTVGTSGAGATTGSASSGSSFPTQTGVCAGAGTRVLTSADTFIDDFEEATGISPGWSSFNDIPADAGGENIFKIMQVAGGAVGTAHSGHYAGTGAITTMNGGFGVGTIYNAAIDPNAGTYCVDISAFDGISFWAKSATAGSTVSVNFVLPSTNAVSMDSMGRQNGGDCVPNATNSNCYNHPRATVTLTASWAQYAVKFSDAGGGSAKVQNVIQELGWLSPDSNWDFSLDEIAFYKGTPPTGPVGTPGTIGPINTDAGGSGGDAGGTEGGN